MYYAYFKHYKSFNTSITGLQYVHDKFGPVPKDFEKIFIAVLDTDPTIQREGKLHGEYPGEDFKSETPPDLTCFSQDEVGTLGFIENFFRPYTGKKISLKSENEKAYKETRDKQRISFAFARDLSI
jgi:hypothetical protein